MIRLIAAVLILLLAALYYFHDDIPFLNREEPETEESSYEETTEPAEEEVSTEETSREETSVTETSPEESTAAAISASPASLPLKELLSGSHGDFVISHAMGGLGTDVTYSNSVEAFEANYAEGHRIFEVDFTYTEDDKIVLWHSWNFQVNPEHVAGESMYYKDFMGTKIYDAYTPMDLKDLLLLMKEHPDMVVVTDSKSKKTAVIKKQFNTLVKTAKKHKCTEVLDRMIIQLYSESMLKTVNNIHKFPAYIFTVYKKFPLPPTPEELEELLKFCKSKKIPMVTMPVEYFIDEYARLAEEYGIALAVHTVNEPAEAEDLYARGVTAIYSDFLTPMPLTE